MNKIRKILAAVMVCFASLSRCLAADPVLVNVDIGNPPFMYVKEGKAAGIYPAIIAAAFARMGVPVTIEAKPWKRAIAEVEEGKAGIGDFYKNEERIKKYDFSEPILSENFAVFFNKKNPVNFRTLADFDGKKVGVIRGWSYGDAFDAARRNNRFIIYEVSSDSANLGMLHLGRLDVAVAVEESGQEEMAASKLTDIEQSRTYLISNKGHLAFAKTARKTELLANFSKTIATMKTDGSLDKIVLKELSK